MGSWVEPVGRAGDGARLGASLLGGSGRAGGVTAGGLGTGWGRRCSGVFVLLTHPLMADCRDPGLAGPQVTAPVLLTCG